MPTIRDLPFPRFSKRMSVERRTRKYELPEDLVVEQWIVPKGTTVILLTGENFGYVVLPPGTQDKRGFRIPKRLFSY